MLRPACGVVLRGESAAGGGAAPARGPDQQRLHLPAPFAGGTAGGQVFPARLTVADTALDVRAFCDTGFSVQEPLSGRTVVLVRFGAVQSRLPPALGTYLEQHFAGAAPLPVPALGVRLVPCTTVAGHCILPAVPASLCCTGSPAGQGMAEHLYAAFADLPPPPDGWEVLVGVEAGDHFQQAHPLSHD